MAWYRASAGSESANCGLFATQIIVETADIEDVQPLEPEEENT